MYRPAFVSLLVAIGLCSCAKHDSLPLISDPPKLVADCLALYKANPDGGILKDKWPTSVSALHPVRVERDGDMILILTFQKTGEGVKGYAVTDGSDAHVGASNAFHLTKRYPGVYSIDYTP